MTYDPAADEIKRAVLAYFGLGGFGTGGRGPRQVMARKVLAYLVATLLGESAYRTHRLTSADRRTISRLRGDLPDEVRVHLEPVVRSIQTPIPFLRLQMDRWLEREGRERQGRLGIA